MPYKTSGVCRYGCTDPTTCPWPHNDCRHCRKVRKEAGVKVNGSAALNDSKQYGERHPL